VTTATTRLYGRPNASRGISSLHVPEPRSLGHPGIPGRPRKCPICAKVTGAPRCHARQSQHQLHKRAVRVRRKQEKKCSLHPHRTNPAERTGNFTSLTALPVDLTSNHWEAFCSPRKNRTQSAAERFVGKRSGIIRKTFVTSVLGLFLRLATI